MPRYTVERTFADGPHTPVNDAGVKAVASVVDTNADQVVTWVHSDVSKKQEKTFCVHDGPSPEAHPAGVRAQRATCRRRHRVGESSLAVQSPDRESP